MTGFTPASQPPVVVDASVLVNVVFGDDRAASLLERWIVDERWVLAPPILWLEVANALIRRHRVPALEVTAGIDQLAASGIETADRRMEGVRMACGLAEQHGLSVCDASYLWLAIDVDGELATSDTALARTAAAEGVPLAFGDLA